MEVFLALSGIGVYENGSVYDGTCMLWDGVGLDVFGCMGRGQEEG